MKIFPLLLPLINKPDKKTFQFLIVGQDNPSPQPPHHSAVMATFCGTQIGTLNARGTALELISRALQAGKDGPAVYVEMKALWWELGYGSVEKWL